jgi:hypothetical protein
VCKTTHRAHDTDSNRTTLRDIEGVLLSQRYKQWWRSKNAHVVVGRRKRVGTLDRRRRCKNTDVGGGRDHQRSSVDPGCRCDSRTE